MQFHSYLLLIKFGKEDRAVIEEEAANREKVANVVSDIVQKMDTDFRGMLKNLNTVREAMDSADGAMNDITNSTESAWYYRIYRQHQRTVTESKRGKCKLYRSRNWYERTSE